MAYPRTVRFANLEIRVPENKSLNRSHILIYHQELGGEDLLEQ